MTQTEIFAKLDEMLAKPKSRNFLNHLVRSYVPLSKTNKVWETPKGEFKCVLTGEDLISANELYLQMHSEDYKKTFKKTIVSLLIENKAQNPLLTLIGDKKLAITGTNTDTFMASDAYQSFMEWVIAKSFKGDKHISWLLGSIRREQFLDVAQLSDDKQVAKKAKDLERQITKDNTAKYSLGDTNDALLKLKQKMENEGK
jgi:hypothetical protein